MHYKIIEIDKNFKYVLFLHGFMGSINDWAYFTENLKNQYNFLLVDLPGHGKSIGLSDNDFTFKAIFDFIAKVINQNNLGKVHLLSYSMGGRIAIGLLNKFPELFNKVILESTTAGIENFEQRTTRKKNDRNLAKKIKNSDFKLFLDNWYDLGLWGNIKSHQDYNKMIQNRLDNKPSELARSLTLNGTGNQESYWDKISNYNHDILFIAGEKDKKYSQIANKFSSKVSSSKKLIIENAAHNVHFEQKEKFLEIIIDHFGE